MKTEDDGERLLNLRVTEPIIVTREEYEELRKAVSTRILLDRLDVGDRILLKHLQAGEYQYHSAVQRLKNREKEDDSKQ